MIRKMTPAPGATARERLSKLLAAVVMAFLSPTSAKADVTVRDLQIVGRRSRLPPHPLAETSLSALRSTPMMRREFKTRRRSPVR